MAANKDEGIADGVVDRLLAGRDRQKSRVRIVVRWPETVRTFVGTLRRIPCPPVVTGVQVETTNTHTERELGAH